MNFLFNADLVDNISKKLLNFDKKLIPVKMSISLTQEIHYIPRHITIVTNNA